MSGDKLSSLQWRALKALSGLEPSWALTGGAALAGIHLRHRTTRDLDLFWHRRDQLGTLTADVIHRLIDAGLEVSTVQTSAAFVQLRINDESEVCLVDLVADPVPALEDPLQINLGDISIRVDTVHEILVNKLCALLSRSEIRDLQDVKALMEEGVDLNKALADAPRKDSGFSPLTLAWVLKSFQTKVLARAAGIEDQAERMEEFKQELIGLLLKTSAPIGPP